MQSCTRATWWQQEECSRDHPRYSSQDWRPMAPGDIGEQHRNRAENSGRFPELCRTEPRVTRLAIANKTLSLLIWRFTSAPTSQGVSQSQPFSTRAFISEYAASMSRVRAAAFVAVPGLSFTWRMNLPVPCSKRPESGSAAP